MSTENKLTSLESLEAYIESIKGDHSSALTKLEGHTDPVSVRRRLSILIDCNRHLDAAESARYLEPNREWLDLATLAYAFIGDVAKADECLLWAISQHEEVLSQKAALKYIIGRMHAIFIARSVGARLAPGSLGQSELQGIKRIVDLVQPVCNAILLRGRVEVELESQLLQRYLDIVYLTGERTQASAICSVLITRTPIPARIGAAILQGIAAPDVRTVSRLWDENTESFDARFVACVLLGRRLGDIRTAKLRAMSLAVAATNQREREDVCELLYELWVNSPDGSDFSEIEKFTSDLLGTGSFVLALFKADQELNRGNHDAALAILEAVRNDEEPRWLSSYANAKAKAGDRIQALDIFQRVSSIVTNTDLLLATASLAREQGRHEEERSALLRAVGLDPINIPIRRRLSMLFVDSGEYLKAAEQLESLSKLLPDEDEVILNLALCYAYANEVDQALRVLEPKSPISILPLNLLKARAQILQSSNNVDRALIELKHARATYWDEPEFLLIYMNLAYAGGDEREANEALCKLHELREQGAVDEKLMRMVGMDEVKKWLEDAAEKHDLIHQNILEGKFPWVMAAEIQGEVPYWAWLLKTQPMDWIWDAPLNRARYSLYSTNSFGRVDMDGASSLELIRCPSKGTPVVVDLTALITLHSLEMISHAADYFGSLLIPAIYLSQVLEDTRKLLPHQQSRRDAANSIISKVSQRRVAVLANETDSYSVMTIVDEYIGGQNADARLSLADLINSLERHGFLNEHETKEAQAVSHRPISSNGRLEPGQKIVVAGTTLATLNGLGLLNLVTREFEVSLPKSDYDEFVAQSRAFASLEEAHAKYTDLWVMLRSDSRITFAPAPLRREFEIELAEKTDGMALSLAAMHLAQSRKLPLFVDDRVSQMLMLNESYKDPTTSFGTDAFLITAHEAGLIDAVKAARHFLKLMEWRYRFILMPPELLKSLADQYRNNPPGLAMRRVAKYVHDCMSDAGLFSGLEQTTSPTSIAVRLYQSWAQNVSDLILDVWMDKSVQESYAEEFTSWAIVELLPSPPRVLDDPMQSRIASLTARTVISRSLVRSLSSRDFERTNIALSAISSALGISDAEYFDIVANVVSKSYD